MFQTVVPVVFRGLIKENLDIRNYEKRRSFEIIVEILRKSENCDFKFEIPTLI